MTKGRIDPHSSATNEYFHYWDQINSLMIKWRNSGYNVNYHWLGKLLDTDIYSIMFLKDTKHNAWHLRNVYLSMVDRILYDKNHKPIDKVEEPNLWYPQITHQTGLEDDDI